MPVGPLKPLRLPPPLPWAALGEYRALAWVSPALLWLSSGCIPMVPGSFAAQAIFGLFELTAPHLNDPAKIAMTTMEFTLRVIFTIGAIGAGLSIATHIFRSEVHD